MYKVILVDDEALIRDAISKNVPWEETGFELVGVSENGREALKLIEECRPDLVLTDIFMPVMDGLALSAHIQQHYPDIKVVIISGYDDFEYAKKAIKYEVVDYIIKPITSYELVEELKMIRTKIDSTKLFEDQKVVYSQVSVSPKEDRQDKFIRQIDNLILAIKLESLADIEKEVSNIFTSLRQSGRERKQLLVVVQNLALTILITLEINAPEHIGDYDKEGLILRLTEQKHFSDVEKIFLNFCQELAKRIDDMRGGDNQKQAIMAMDYIEKNYMDVDISLNKVCEYLCVSTSYFSVIFKNATGETFIEALTRVRMKKAKELLESTNMKNYEIATAVGYQDPHYFSSTFKKHVLMTPTEYAKQLPKRT